MISNVLADVTKQMKEKSNGCPKLSVSLIVTDVSPENTTGESASLAGRRSERG